MYRITLVIGIIILGIFTQVKISIGNSDKNVAAYSSRSGLEQKSENNLKRYDSVYYFPLDEITYSGPEAIALLERSYQIINFYGDFKTGNLELYDFFKLNFKRLLDNEVTFTRNSTGEKMYLKEFDGLECDVSFNPSNYSYLFFDMDEDETPELCISKMGESESYIYKYNPKNDAFTLIHELFPSYYQLNGSNKIRWDGGGGSWLSYVFYQYDKLSREEYAVSFVGAPNYNEKKGESEVVYMAGLPHYTDKSKQIVIPDALKEQAYIDKSYDMYYFRITEERFDDLTKDYRRASEFAAVKVKDLTRTYEELFSK